MRETARVIVLLLAFCLLLSPALAVIVYDRWPMSVCLSVAASLMAVILLALTLGGLPALFPMIKREKEYAKPQLRKFLVEELQTMQESAKIVQGEPYLLRSRGIVEHCLYMRPKGTLGTPAIEMVCHENSFLDAETGAPKACDEILDLLFRLLYDVQKRPQPPTVPLVKPQRLLKALTDQCIVLYLSRKHPPFHFAVIDDERVYLEEHHRPRSASHGYYYGREPLLARMYTEEFLELLCKVEDDKPLVSRIPFESTESATLVSIRNRAVEAYRWATGER